MPIPIDEEPQTQVDTQRFHAAFAGRSFDVLKAQDDPAVQTGSLGYYAKLAAEKGMSAQTDALRQNCTYEADGSGFTCKVPPAAIHDGRQPRQQRRFPLLGIC